MKDFEERTLRRWKSKPFGRLAELLKGYEAPEDIQEQIARRAGGAISDQFPVSSIEKLIHESMRNTGGAPDWEAIVNDHLPSQVNGAYKNFRK